MNGVASQCMTQFIMVVTNHSSLCYSRLSRFFVGGGG